MFPYSYSGICLGSTIELPELEPSAARASSDLTFHLGSSAPSAGLAAAVPQWLQEWNRPDGRPYLSLGAIDSDYLFRFWDYADFRFSPKSAEILACPQPGLDEATLRHLLLDQVLPSLLGRFGRQALHASGIIHDGAVVAFLGDSGFGKSSLAASFAQCGCTLIADDCLILRSEHEQVLASMAYPGVRLVPEAIQTLVPTPGPTLAVAHYSEKHRLPGEQVGPFARQSLPLRYLFALGDPGAAGSAIDINPLSTLETFVALRRGAFSLDIRQVSDNAFEFRLLALAAAQVKAFSLQYPRSWDQLAAVQQAILRTVSSHL